jgi:hypothetical protein
MKRLIAIGCVWVGCAVAWVILGTTLVTRSGESSSDLRSEVDALWGPELVQNPPGGFFRELKVVRETETVYDARGLPVARVAEREREFLTPIELTKSTINVQLGLDQRKKGLMWFSTYPLEFRGTFSFRNGDAKDRRVTIFFPLASGASIDSLTVKSSDGSAPKSVVDKLAFGGAPFPWRSDLNTAHWDVDFAPGQERTYEIAFRSRGTSSWTYRLTADGGQTRRFSLTMNTDFTNVDFPTGGLSPSRHETTPSGWRGEWQFENLIDAGAVAVTLPSRVNPGPLASRITFFAPVGLLFYFFVAAILADLKRQRLHPLNFFFFGSAFFAFHLLFAYLVDHLELLPSFAIASVVSIALVVSYARLFTGWRFAFFGMGVPQAIYLVLFSASFLLDGYTGLAITAGAIITLFVTMQVTGRAQKNVGPGDSTMAQGAS